MTAKEQQCALVLLGYDPGDIDGVAGKRTAAAVCSFQTDAGLTADGLWGHDTEGEAIKWIAAGKKKPAQSAGSEAPATGTFWDEIRYFAKEEYRCPCGKCSGFPAQPQEKLVRLEDRVRSHFGKPIRNSSGVRCKAHNAAVGGVATSRHLTGCAVDFAVSGVSGSKVLAYVKKQPETAYCYQIDGSYVHMDVII